MKADCLSCMPAKMTIGQHAVYAGKCGINTTLHLESRSLFSSSMANGPIHFLAGISFLDGVKGEATEPGLVWFC